MNINIKKADKKIGSYLYEGLIHFYNNFTLYIIPSALMFLNICIAYSLPKGFSYICFIISGYLMYLISYITYESSQENFTLTKYLRMYTLAAKGYVTSIRAYKLTFIVMSLVSLTADIVVHTINGNLFKINTLNLDNFINYLSFNADGFIATYILIVGIYKSTPVSNISVLTRLAESKVIDYRLACIIASRLNYLKDRKFSILSIFVFVLSTTIPFSGVLLAFILTISLTFYSMDIFGIEQKKKTKQEQEKSNTKLNIIPQGT